MGLFDWARSMMQRVADIYRRPSIPDGDANVIERLTETLTQGHIRLVLSAVPLSLAWPSVASPFSIEGMTGQQIRSDWAESTKYPEIERAFREEVLLFQNELSETVVPLSLPPEPDDSKDRSKLANWINGYLAVREQAESVRASALAAWACYGVPYRHHDGEIVRVTPPRMISGTPIIESWPIGVFLRSVALQTSSDAYRIGQLQNQRRVLTLALALAVSLLLWLA